MEKFYSWQRSWKRIKHQRNKFILAGTAIIVLIGLGVFVLALVLASVQLPKPLPDLRNVGRIAVIGLVGISAVIYWTLLGVVVWRWFKTQPRQSIGTEKTLSTARPLYREQPKLMTLPLAQPVRRVPAVTLSPAEFEQEVAFVLGTLFGLHAEVVGKANDGGIDVKLYDPTQTLVAIIQAKRYDKDKTLNPSFLRELDSCKRRMGVPRAYLVTTARFSSDVRQQAQDWHIDLIDGSLFEEWRQKAYASSQENGAIPSNIYHRNNQSRRF